MNAKKRFSDSGFLVALSYAFRRSAVLGIISLWFASLSSGAPGQGEGESSVRISSLAELNERTVLDEVLVASIHIEGTVWWSSKSEGRIILSDETGALQLDLNLPCQMPELGERLILEGECAAIKTRDTIMLSGVPVVENGGLHAPEEQSGKIHLKAGLHPIRVVWFNRTERHGLQVSYEGPETVRQKVPDEALFHLPENAVPGTTNYLRGLRYRNIEGLWWRHLPNFDHIYAVKTGVVPNFDIAVRSRINNVGLQFFGYISVPQDGAYTFYVQSDDGSRLFIGDSSLRVRPAGHEVLPLPEPPVVRAASAGQPEFQRSEIQGTVTSFHRSQWGLEVDVMTEEGMVRVKVAEDDPCSYTLRPQNRIKTVGVGRTIHTLGGSPTVGDFFVQHWDDIEQIYITSTIWNEYPLSTIGDLLPIEASEEVEPVVHLVGRVHAMDAGQPMVLDDESGRIILDGFVPDDCVGQSVHVLGRLSRDGTNEVISCTQFLRMGELGTDAENLPLLTTAEQVSQLSLEEATQGYPMRLRGVITSVNEFMGAVLHDSTRGIYLWLTMPEGTDPADWTPFALQVGDYCEVEGVTMAYGFDPYVPVTKLKILGAGTLPEPVQPTWDQLINGSLHCNYVELEGVVSSIKEDTISLLTRDGRINVQLNPIGPPLPPDVPGATIRLRGCLFVEWDAATHRLVVGKFSLDQTRVTVVRPAPVDPFAIPLKPVGDLLQFDPQAGALQRVKVAGVLIHKDEQMSYLMDGESGLAFVQVSGDFAKVGDRVEVLGYLDISGLSPLLTDAVVRRLGMAEPLVPRRLESHELLNEELDSTLVQVEGVLQAVSSLQDGLMLEIQSGLRRFMTRVDADADVDSWIIGSRLELTGVYVGMGGNRVLGQPINSFQLHLNSARDIRVLSRPSWWTPKRMFMVVGLLVAVLLAAMVWIELLRRKVEQRTEQLGDQIQRRQRAERLQEIEQERARLANDLHDDLGAGLTEVNMLASLVKRQDSSPQEIVRYADEMTGLALRMVSSLDEIVWAVNPRNDTIVSLAAYFGSYAQRFLELASIACGLDMEEDLPDESLDPKFRQELFMAFKEALTNIVRHADAKKAWLRILIEDDELVVIVSDDGCGIIESDREEGADGLANMQERLNALGGRCEIESDPAKGTIVRMQAPIQKALV